MVMLSLDSFGDQQLSRRLLRFTDRVDDMRPALRVIADDFLDIQKSQFTSQGRYGSGGWRPLAPTTVASKARRGHDPHILHATLRLRKSLTSKYGPDVVRKITRNEMFVGTRVPYAKHHQHGAPRARLPQRRPVELPARDRKNWMKILQRYLVEGDV